MTIEELEVAFGPYAIPSSPTIEDKRAAVRDELATRARLRQTYPAVNAMAEFNRIERVWRAVAEDYAGKPMGEL